MRGGLIMTGVKADGSGVGVVWTGGRRGRVGGEGSKGRKKRGA